MIIEVADTAAVLTVAEDVEVLAEGDLLLVRIGVGVKCLKRFAVTAEKNAKYLLDPQMASRFTAAIVLKKWAEGATDRLPIDPDLMTGLADLRHKVDRIWAQLTPNWIKF